MVNNSVTELKKQGRLDEAIALGEDLMQNPEVDPQDANALFWCYYDKAKNLLNEPEALVPWADKMQDVYQLMPPSQAAQSSLDRVLAAMVSDADRIAEACHIAGMRGGEPEAYHMVSDLIGNAAPEFHEDLAWIMYRYAASGFKNLSPDELMHVLNQYLHLDVARPSRLHSDFLELALRLARRCPAQRQDFKPQRGGFNNDNMPSFDFAKFYRQWNPENLLEEDYQVKVGPDGREYDSNAVEAASRVFEGVKDDLKAALTAPRPDSMSREEAMQLAVWVMMLLESVASEPGADRWVKRAMAMLKLWTGDRDGARELMLQLGKGLASMHYYWADLAECYDDIDLRIALLGKAFTLQRDESFLGALHLKMARLLMDKGMPENALVELNVYARQRQREGRRPAREWQVMMDELEGVETDLYDNRDLYFSCVQPAEDVLYGEAPWARMAVTKIFLGRDNRERVVLSDGGIVTVFVPRARFAPLRQCHEGQIFDVRLQADVDNQGNNIFNVVGINYTDEPDWSILPLKYGILFYRKEDTGMVLISPADAENVIAAYNLGPEFSPRCYVSYRLVMRRVKDRDEPGAEDVRIVTEQEALPHFEQCSVTVDYVNDLKQFVHFSDGPRGIDGIVRYKDLDFAPVPGDRLDITYLIKNSRDGQPGVEVIAARRVL
jgi:hypothetical protein